MYKKTIVIDSFGDITEQLEQEQNKEYEQLSKDASMMKEIFKDLSKITGDCYDPLQDVLEHTEHTIHNTEQGTEHLVKASTIKAKTNKLLLASGSIIGGSVGLIIGGILGSVLHIPGITLGAQIGLITGCIAGGGSLGTGIGAVSACTLQK